MIGRIIFEFVRDDGTEFYRNTSEYTNIDIGDVLLLEHVGLQTLQKLCEVGLQKAVMEDKIDKDQLKLIDSL